MTNHLGYESNEHGTKKTSTRRNGYSKKTLKTSGGTVDISVPRDQREQINIVFYVVKTVCQ